MPPQRPIRTRNTVINKGSCISLQMQSCSSHLRGHIIPLYFPWKQETPGFCSECRSLHSSSSQSSYSWLSLTAEHMSCARWVLHSCPGDFCLQGCLWITCRALGCPCGEVCCLLLYFKLEVFESPWKCFVTWHVLFGVFSPWSV